MSVALKRQEFDHLEVEEISLHYPGVLSEMFGTKATNEDTFSKKPHLQLVEDFNTDKRSYLGEVLANHHAFDYSIRKMEDPAAISAHPAPLFQGTSTEVGRIMAPTSADEREALENRRRKEAFEFVLQQENMRRQSEYREQLERRLIDIDLELDKIAQERDKLNEREKILSEVNDLLDGNTQGLSPTEIRNRKLLAARRLGLDSHDFTDEHGNVNDAALDDALRDAQKREREDINKYRLELDEREIALRREKEELLAQAKSGPTQKQDAELEDRKAKLVSQFSASTSSQQPQKVENELEAMLMAAFTQSAPITHAAATVQATQYATPTTPQALQQNNALILTGDRITGSFAETLDSNIGKGIPSITNLNLNSSFSRAANAEIELAPLASTVLPQRQFTNSLGL